VKRLFAIVPIAALLLLVIVFTTHSLRRTTSEVTPTATVGKPMPDLVLAPLAGGAPMRLRGVAKGPVLVNFYASWCPPCVVEAPVLLGLKAQGVRIVGVAYKDTAEANRGFLARYGNPFETVLMDPDARGGIDFGVTAPPETYAIDAAGVIRAKHVGALTPDTAETLLRAAGL
jgi:cytochrome c biogenesis protein CcmG/thiol:disulfide interchange protein DsbE